MRIYCPKCGWQPLPESRWVCACDFVWNTFETRGVCPNCGKVWKDTQCPNCHGWSPHDDWYHGEDRAPSVDVTQRREHESAGA